MKSWDIIGWIVLVALVLWGWAIIGTRLCYCAVRLWLHYKTRNTPPQEGQRWNQDGDSLVIGRRYPAGHFSVTCGGASWGEDDAEWKKRVRNRRLFLEKGAK